MIGRVNVGGGGSDKLPSFSYTGSYTMLDDSESPLRGKGKWRIKFLTSGTLTFLDKDRLCDVFCVGGGGGGGYAGGGGGYTTTSTNIQFQKNVDYAVVVGAGSAGGQGGTSSLNNVSALGGYSSSNSTGGAGGSSGSNNYGSAGGSDGGSGTGNSLGQGTTTREFAPSVTKAYIVSGSTAFSIGWLSLTSGGTPLTPQSGVVYSVMDTGTYWYKDYYWNGSSYVETDLTKVYSGGGGLRGASGGAGGGGGASTVGTANTGGGGGGYGGQTWTQWYSGGSGIVVIRNPI